MVQGQKQERKNQKNESGIRKKTESDVLLCRILSQVVYHATFRALALALGKGREQMEKEMGQQRKEIQNNKNER